VKLRITNDELRLRLSPADVGKLRQGVILRETLSLPGKAIHFELDSKGSTIGASVSDNVIRVTVPPAAAAHWSVNDEETLSEVIGEGCRVSIEKDRR